MSLPLKARLHPILANARRPLLLLLPPTGLAKPPLLLQLRLIEPNNSLPNLLAFLLNLNFVFFVDLIDGGFFGLGLGLVVGETTVRRLEGCWEHLDFFEVGQVVVLALEFGRDVVLVYVVLPQGYLVYD
jgi:hypothetical protein